jgi:hypothetical protein
MEKSSQEIGDAIRTAAEQRWLYPEEIYQIIAGDPTRFGFSVRNSMILNPKSKSFIFLRLFCMKNGLFRVFKTGGQLLIYDSRSNFRNDGIVWSK